MRFVVASALDMADKPKVSFKLIVPPNGLGGLDFVAKRKFREEANLEAGGQYRAAHGLKVFAPRPNGRLV